MKTAGTTVPVTDLPAWRDGIEIVAILRSHQWDQSCGYLAS
jgi:hypothetical protein